MSTNRVLQELNAKGITKKELNEHYSKFKEKMLTVTSKMNALSQADDIKIKNITTK